jgi:hypothetical protein
MSNYRRARVPGATYFFTVNLRDRSSDLLVRGTIGDRPRLTAAHLSFSLLISPLRRVT